MKYGSLFSGAGLGDFGFEMAGLECAWQVENNEYCRKILDLRWPEVKKYGDIKTIKPEELEPVDLITGGFPCQPFSVAGKQHGADDDRNLWPQMFRVVKELKPRFVVAENVLGIINLYLDTVLADLESEGYTCWPIVFSSHSLGAWHKRERLWIMGNTGLFGPSEHEKQTTGIKQSGQDVADTKEWGLSKRMSEKRLQHNVKCGSISNGGFRAYWRQDPSQTTTKPELGRVAYGIAHRVDRLKALGNGQTPCSTYAIGKWIMEIERATHP